MATLVARRFGQSVAGWLIAFPFTSAPVSLFLALDHGLPFAAAAARGSVASVVAGTAYAVTYAHVTRGWPLALAFASAAYCAVALLMSAVALDVVPLAALVLVLLVLAGRGIPRRAAAAVPAPPPRWDLPARVAVATVLVVAVTSLAPALGPFGSAAAATFPLFASILGVFAERHAGHDAASEVMRGLVAGLPGFTLFFLMIALGLVPLGYAAFALATLAILALQAASLAVLRRAG